MCIYVCVRPGSSHYVSLSIYIYIHTYTHTYTYTPTAPASRAPTSRWSSRASRRGPRLCYDYFTIRILYYTILYIIIIILWLYYKLYYIDEAQLFDMIIMIICIIMVMISVIDRIIVSMMSIALLLSHAIN